MNIKLIKSIFAAQPSTENVRKQVELLPSQDKDGCETNFTGDVCFNNETKKDIVLFYHYFENDGLRKLSDPIIIKADITKCAYSLSIQNAYHYQAFVKPSAEENVSDLTYYFIHYGRKPAPIDAGDFKIEKCKSISVSIR